MAPGLDATERERLALYRRAALLDWVIDPLADWIDADGVLEAVTEVRSAKQRTHEAALALYRARHPAAEQPPGRRRPTEPVLAGPRQSLHR